MKANNEILDKKEQIEAQKSQIQYLETRLSSL